MEVIDVREGEYIDPNFIDTIENIWKEVHVEGKTRSSTLKSGSLAGENQKHIVIKGNKKVSDGPGPKKRKVSEKESCSVSKRRRKDEEEKFMSKEKRNKIPKF